MSNIVHIDHQEGFIMMNIDKNTVVNSLEFNSVIWNSIPSNIRNNKSYINLILKSRNGNQTALVLI